MKILFNIVRLISVRIPDYIVNDSQILGERRFEKLSEILELLIQP